MAEVDENCGMMVWAQVNLFKRTFRILRSDGTQIADIVDSFIHEILETITDELKLSALSGEEGHKLLSTIGTVLSDTLMRNSLLNIDLFKK